MKVIVAGWAGPLTFPERHALALSLLRSRALFRNAARAPATRGDFRKRESLSAAAGDCAGLYQDVTGKKVPR